MTEGDELIWTPHLVTLSVTAAPSVGMNREDEQFRAEVTVLAGAGTDQQTSQDFTGRHGR